MTQLDLTAAEVARFWSRVRKGDGCWLWTGRTDDSGYGLMDTWRNPRARIYRAQRVAYELTYGLQPEGTCFLHHCDNPPCVRPDHVFPGTRKENSDDKTRKGRVPHGSGHWNAKRTEQDARDIRRLSRAGLSGRAIARLFDCPPSGVAKILRGESWARA